MQEELELFHLFAQKGNKKKDFSAMKNAQKVTQPLYSIAISYVQKDSEMMVYFVDYLKQEEELAIHGGLVMAGQTMECSKDVKKIMVRVIASFGVILSTPNARQASQISDAVFVGHQFQIVGLQV